MNHLSLVLDIKLIGFFQVPILIWYNIISFMMIKTVEFQCLEFVSMKLLKIMLIEVLFLCLSRLLSSWFYDKGEASKILLIIVINFLPLILQVLKSSVCSPFGSSVWLWALWVGLSCGMVFIWCFWFGNNYIKIGLSVTLHAWLYVFLVLVIDSCIGLLACKMHRDWTATAHCASNFFTGMLIYHIFFLLKLDFSEFLITLFYSTFETSWF